jgi:hypothetical protein
MGYVYLPYRQYVDGGIGWFSVAVLFAAISLGGLLYLLAREAGFWRRK